MGGKKIDLINSAHLLRKASLVGGGWGAGRLQSFSLFVVKQNKTKWKTPSIGNDMISQGLLVHEGEWRGGGGGGERGDGYQILVWISKPFISRIEEEITSLLVFYLSIYTIRRRFGSFKPSLYNLLRFQLSYVMFSVFLCHFLL